MGAKPRIDHKRRRVPIRDGDPFPLGHGDFVLAYAYAKRWLTLDNKRVRRHGFKVRRRGRTRAEIEAQIRDATAKKAADKGLAELAKVRGVEKLPRRGSRKLRDQLRGALETAWDRWDDPNRGDVLAHKPPLKERWTAYVSWLVRRAFIRTWYYYVAADGDVSIRIGTAQARINVDAQRTAFPSGTPRPGATYVVLVTRDWYHDVHKRGLDIVDGRVVLAARRRWPSDPDLLSTADVVYEVTYVVKGHGYQLHLQDGIAARVGDVWTLVPYATEGTLQHTVADLHRAYRTAERRLRKLAYQQYRKDKAS